MACEFVAGSLHGDGQLGDLPGPATLLGFDDAFFEVGDDRGQPVELGGVDSEYGAAQAGVFVFAAGAVGAGAAAQFDPAQGEVFFELFPFGVGGFAVLLRGTAGAPVVDEGAVGADQVVLEDRDVGFGAGQVPMAQDLGGDVQREPVLDGCGGEDPTKVVRGVERPPG